MLRKSSISYLLSFLIVFLSLFATFSPEFQYYNLFFEFLTQSRAYFIAVFLIFSIFFVFKRYFLLFSLQIICIFANFFIIYQGYGPHYEKKICRSIENPASIRALSVNVYYKNEDYDRVIRSIRLANADIVFLQEVQSGLYHAGHKDLLKDYPFYYSELEHGIAHGKAIYSKYPIEKVQVQTFHEGFYKALKADIIIENQLVSMVGIHSLSPKSKWRILRRHEHIAALQGYIEKLQKEGGPLLVLGDFNTTAWHPVMRRFKEQTQLNNNSFYNIVGTWPSWLPTFLNLPIDHIFYNSNFKNVQYSRGLASGSDHYPIYADLEICE